MPYTSTLNRTINKTLRNYGYAPCLWCFSFLAALGVMQGLIGRHNDEALKFLLAAALFGLIDAFFSRKKKSAKAYCTAILIYMLPSLTVAGWAAMNMPEEATPEEYSEIMNGLKSPKNDASKKIVIAKVEEALRDGKMSRWEAAEARNLIFQSNGWLYRGDAAPDTLEARKQLAKVLADKKTLPAGEKKASL